VPELGPSTGYLLTHHTYGAEAEVRLRRASLTGNRRERSVRSSPIKIIVARPGMQVTTLADEVRYILAC